MSLPTLFHCLSNPAMKLISNHNIVLTCLPAETTGSVSATIITKDMIRSFPAVRFRLIIGISSRALYYNTRENNNSARIKDEDDPEDIQDIQLNNILLQEKEFIYTGSKLNKLPNIILEYKISKTFLDTILRYLTLDYLFKSTIIYEERKKSYQAYYRLLDQNLIKKKDHPNSLPQLHYRTISSADQEEKIIYFKIEAASQ
ncbi:hypothetical protein P170DRAFT_448254 [Aspergillus steynii IBT 23096]|uniref:Uncharacterized protein n=1 Tax=Aspergillus steynii IBT 23096 TaxID=1392250 RepID=A0A2I2G0C8_9EURO|nr:uncharacterized protein P170DRAFT_448254 [Aspergillus steynii IBT 23096]PLB46330.1 hypothetical protein P170DRAFT_448254 [Aspergillus steynii IBT 23096]